MTSQQIICAASSSSSSSLVSSKKNDVFLSFRGEDTRRTFTSHLYRALIGKNFKTFIDDNELQKGDDISPSLTKAIEESYISIVIFSKDYASSKWCLNELIKILECKNSWGQIVIPVFYNIDPSHIRNQTDTYQEAFAKHEENMKLNKDILQKWKYALFEASKLVGFDSSKYKNDAVLVKDIVEDVLRKLKPRHPLIIKERGLVGIEQKCEEMISLLKMGSNDVRSLGVWGMGGSGKTTLVEVLFAELFSQFEGYCFIKNVREKSQRCGLEAVINRLFFALSGEENLRPDAPWVEIPSIMKRLLRKKLLIVLDDVATLEQMKCLTQYNHFLGQGSRVIITTRDKQIIKCIHAIYEVDELNECDSLELFCLKAFGEKHPKIGFEELSKSAISYCKGNPLALEVLGARLNSRTQMQWECVFRKLQKMPDDAIYSVLKLSYDDLDPKEKDIFLDIACFFKDKSIETVKSVMEACDLFPNIGLEVLKDKALITIEYNQIEMHDLIQEMGRNIVNQIEEPGERSRLWECEEVADVLKNNKGTKAVKGIRLYTSELGEDLSLSSDCFKGMTNLRYLKIHSNVYEVRLYDGLEWLSDKLRYLEWDKFPLESLPSTFCAKMLVKLHMKESKLKKLWDGVQNLVNLKEIDISRSKDLNEMPDLSRATNLEIVYLDNCSSLCELHPSVLSLPKLKELYLRDCTKIKSLKSNTHSKSLCMLILEDCSSLMEFSVTSEEMTRLNLERTAIRELPSSIWRNSKLEDLDLSGCKELSSVGKKLSNDLGIVSLKSLNLSWSRKMDAFKLSRLLDGIQSLKELRLDGCCNLKTLPHNIHKHTELTNLSLSCTAIRELPSSIWRNSKLEDLDLSGCKELSSVGKKLSNDLGIVSLKLLNLSWSTKMDAFKLSRLLDGIQSLKELRLDGCCNLKTLPHSIHKHTELTWLSLGGSAISELPSSIWRNSKLFKLDLSGCEELSIVGKKLSNDPGIVFLWKLDLSRCTQLDALNLSRLLDGIQSLKALRLVGCCNLKTLPHNIHKHTELKTLVLDGCIDLVLSSPTELLPPSLGRLSAVNCTLMDTSSTQRVLLDNMLQSISAWDWRLHWERCFLLVRGEQVPDRFSFQGVNSITIPHIPKSNLKGFCFCLLVSKGMKLANLFRLKCYICEQGEEVGEFSFFNELEVIEWRYPFDCGNDAQTLISDHVFVFWCHKFDSPRLGKSEGDHFNIEFKFQYLREEDCLTDVIKGCGVLPVRRVEIVELESEASDVDEFEASDVELESQACDVDEFEARSMSNKEDVDNLIEKFQACHIDEFEDQQQPPKKKMRA